MYQPPHFRNDDLPQIRALMREQRFVTLISSGSLGLFATHLPTVTKDDAPYAMVECHLARANAHWKDLATVDEALMVFQGPQAYITPNWYRSKAEHGKVVPTWNYVALHAYARPEVVEDADWLRRHVAELTAQEEKVEPKPWALSDAPDDYVERMLRGIVGFRLRVARLEGKWKVSQNREPEDRDGVVTGLRSRGDGDDLRVAEAISASLRSGTAGAA
jgi:transcriptional regulator